jgi:CubicO group peptidase (beta-lactamase class C family)
MDQLQKILSDQVNENKSPSIQYRIFNKESIIKSYSSGFADIENRRKADENTSYNAYSVTKTFTALAVLQLAENKMLDPGKPAVIYLPGIPYDSDITVRHLLTHTSGIPNPLPLSWIHLKEEHNTFDRNMFFHEIFLKNSRTRSEPNEKFAYSNLGYVLLGQIIEKVSGLTYEEYIKQNIIDVLGIPESELGFGSRDTIRQAVGYHKKSSASNLLLGFLIDRPKFMSKAAGKWIRFRDFYVNGPSYGGLTGTPDAFVKYLQELLRPDCRLISKDYGKMLFTQNYTSRNEPTGMCFSWFTGKLCGRTYFAHAGGGGGFYCEIRIYPEEGIGSVVFFNRTGMSDKRFLDKPDRIFFAERYNCAGKTGSSQA